MSKAATKTKASLPYGMVLTLLFEEFNIDISEGEPKKSLHHMDIYNKHSLHRMGYRKRNDQWEWRGAEQRVFEEGEPSREEAEAAPESRYHLDMPTSPAPSQPSTFFTIRLDDDQMRRMVNMLVDELTSRGQVLMEQPNYI